MAEMIGMQYINIAAAAVIPAVAYFGSAYILVHLIARKRHIGRVSGVGDNTKPVLPRIYRLFPIVLLVILIVSGTSMFGMSRFMCIVPERAIANAPASGSTQRNGLSLLDSAPKMRSPPVTRMRPPSSPTSSLRYMVV